MIPRLFLLASLTTTLVLATEEMMMISDFSLSDGEYLEMETVDDPVMGGTSSSTFEILEGEYLEWSGTVEIVDYLNSPGFCILQTKDDDEDFTGLGKQSGISFFVEKSTMDTMLQPMSAQLTTGAISSTNGEIITYEGELRTCELRAGIMDDTMLVELFVPWGEFKPTFRGFVVDDAPLLTAEELDKTYRIGLSTYSSHSAGDFTVKLIKIAARAADSEVCISPIAASDNDGGGSGATW
eukprot:CAMPEP_0116028334 /NCGR_PEP_ID=MMETSP0321-20121206/15328_1 /TAXON_ID=163516 /ORGANISM="Leptocylindrus danicus var. danicus, Strain B650" /LENGTH=238 /DNA_ID=CAMNT_0003502191 /DNA_START=73 /DNA_END=786 /DNA_ORIENTATION=+